MRIGIDLGGTKIEGIWLDDLGRVCARLRRPTPSGDYDATVAAIADIVFELERRANGAGTVGVGIPGALSPASGLVKNANSTWIIGHALDRDLETVLRRPIRIANDANCFAISEAVDGAAAGAEVVFGVILGTGVGGGITVNGQLLTGVNAIAGEWGHNPLPWQHDDERPGPSCYCGKRGCIETFLSGPGFARSISDGFANSLLAPEIFALAESGNPTAISAVECYEDRLARALASVINVIDPDVIVLGGGMSNVNRLYDSVPRAWGQWVFSDQVETKLARNLHGDSSGVRGAAWLWRPGESGTD